MTSTVVAGVGHILAAAAAVTHRDDLKVKHLYLDSLFKPNDQDLQNVLKHMDNFVKDCPWACVPFLNYSRTNIVDPDYPRPTDDAYLAHLEGSANPLLPNGNPLGGSIIGVENMTYEDFTYYNTHRNPPDPNVRKEYRRTRCFAAAWNFIDPLDIIDRIAVRNGAVIKPVPVEDCCVDDYCDDGKGTVQPQSSGNGYKCTSNGCVPANASAFCVSSSCP